MFGASLSHITAEAVVPEQLVHYVRAVSGRRALLCREYAAYIHEGHAVLAAYSGAPRAEPRYSPSSCDAKGRGDPDWSGGPGKEAGEAQPRPAPGSPFPEPPSLHEALEELAKSCSSVTVLAPYRPKEAPSDAESRADLYWRLPIPAPPVGQKLRNMLTRAGRDLTVEIEAWSDEHADIVREYLDTRPLPPGTRAVFSSINRYALQEPDDAPGEARNVLLVSARLNDGRLTAFSIGDFSGLHTAFYMFAFRRKTAPPGSADLLLARLLSHAETMGHSRMNLGLGINSGIGFFKKKWKAQPFLPYVETSWQLPAGGKKTLAPGFLSRVSGLWGKKP
ncbi:MAG: DUF2156 domain-containing protein [Desulfovibrio sp.]|jgi:hypothetical protein|nr:DUF2156 domain-containing protein [Desulfovibrio sp.]